MGNNNRRRSALADKDALTKAVNCSKNMKEVLERMGLRAAGGNFKQLKKYANEFGIELPKADPRDKLQAAHFKNVTPDELVFCEDSTFSNRESIKRRLRARGYPERCALCGLGTTWNGRPITLQLDHINGRSNDNRIENLRLLCPNCHAQTETFRGYNIKPRKHCKCGAVINNRSKQCGDCARKARSVIDWPSISELKRLVSENGYSGAGRILGVSDNAIRKHIEVRTPA